MDDRLADDLEDSPDYYWTQLSPYPASIRALGAMMLANRRRLDSSAWKVGEMRPGLPPRWSSTVTFVDQVCGGMYGLTTVGGFEGLGKSLLARACAIEAAASLRWNVIVFDAENASDELQAKYDAYLDAYPHAADALSNLLIVPVTRGMDIPDLIGFVDQVAADDRPVLTVMDSINTTAELMGGDYLRNVRDLSLWAMMARRISRGMASFLVVSELNRRGGSKGEKLNYWSDLFLSLTGDRELGWVRLKIRKTRSTAGEGQEQKLVRHVPRCRFLSQRELTGDQQHLKMVRGGADEDEVL